MAPQPPSRRKRTTTSNFGVGGRESHDASGFYGRFRAPELSADSTVLQPSPVIEPFVHGDARAMSTVADGSVALVVTSPPYFAGKQYEEELEREGIPSSYLEYLQMLTDVFGECVRTLEPGGRIAVNVANLGRKPYRSLSADVIRILEHDLGLLLRGELIWQKGAGASGSCAWGSYRGASNPVLRDISERVIVASKGRFDRALSVKARQQQGLPHVNTQRADDFMAATLDVWSLPTESAKRVGHPAPFPVELPDQLIRLYTFADDLVLDPFMGSGSTMVAASRLCRRFVGYDLDASYVELARQRVAAEGQTSGVAGSGETAQHAAEAALVAAGFTVTGRQVRAARTGVAIDVVATDATQRTWWFDIAGPNTSSRGGMQRMDVVWRAIGRGVAVRAARRDTPLVVLTTAMPAARSEGAKAVRASIPDVLCDVIDLTSGDDVQRLGEYGRGGGVGS